MKRILIMLLLAVIANMAFAQSGTIREMYGDVQLKHAGASAFVKAENGTTVAQSTVVSTGFKSGAVITVGSSTISVQPLTRLTLAEIISTSDSEKLNISLQTGKIRVEVKPPSGLRTNTSVQSPSSTASVRGTIFEIDTYSINVIEGNVYAQGNKDGTGQNVSEGNTVNADGFENLTNPLEEGQKKLAPPGPPGAVNIKRGGGSGSGDFEVVLIWPWQ